MAHSRATETFATRLRQAEVTSCLLKAGRGVALVGVILPLALIGVTKFTAIEVEALRPLIENTPWLAWLNIVFGAEKASALIGSVELITAVLPLLSPWSARSGLIGGLLAAGTFIVTSSIMLALPIWEADGFPFINATGQFLIKDVVMAGVALVVFGESLQKLLKPETSS